MYKDMYYRAHKWSAEISSPMGGRSGPRTLADVDSVLQQIH